VTCGHPIFTGFYQACGKVADTFKFGKQILPTGIGRMGRNPAKTLRQTERDAILGALAAGVVPAAGLLRIQVGRQEEIATLLRDMNHIADAGASVKFVIGERGAGKTFFASIVRLIALERKTLLERIPFVHGAPRAPTEIN
jgi:P-loop Domain of unknown function (DUF2791)